jgi:hypothetical protein
MSLSQALRKIWHGVYYALAPQTLQTYALTCREAVNDLNTKKEKSFQVNLHLSLCQACTNYEGYSVWLRNNFPEKKSGLPLDLSQKVFAKIREIDGKK